MSYLFTCALLCRSPSRQFVCCSSGIRTSGCTFGCRWRALHLFHNKTFLKIVFFLKKGLLRHPERAARWRSRGIIPNKREKMSKILKAIPKPIKRHVEIFESVIHRQQFICIRMCCLSEIFLTLMIDMPFFNE